MDWIDLAHDTDQWPAGYFVTRQGTVSFSIATVIHRVSE